MTTTENRTRNLLSLPNIKASLRDDERRAKLAAKANEAAMDQAAYDIALVKAMIRELMPAAVELLFTEGHDAIFPILLRDTLGATVWAHDYYAQRHPAVDPAERYCLLEAETSRELWYVLHDAVCAHRGWMREMTEQDVEALELCTYRDQWENLYCLDLC